ncbi:isoniazid response ATPase/transcriptional regulator IniR [Mycolicibacterium sp. S3B2]|uniref:isoniazid response ATPase/transcriptional regulator IniR n=1 Tax=Mycolicibacterium sp. S3B2 TaxID=3415120 RepID=UPI003C7B8D52
MRVPPAARAAVASLAAAPTEPAVMAVTGGIGTGKSSTLAAVRVALDAGGVAVTPRLPRPGEKPGQAVVIDDAHLLDDDALHQLTELVLDRTCTVVVAAEPLTHRPALRALVIAVQRERPVLALSALTAADIADAAATILATEPSPELIRALTTVTGGLPLLITAALSEPGTDPVALARRAEQALTERLRWCDDAVLDAVVVLSLSGELGAADLAAAMRIEVPDAVALVDRARASGLLGPSLPDTFLQRVHHCAAHSVGAARHRQLETTLLTTQLDAASLSAELALQLAEHGLQDDRLARPLTDLAGRPDTAPARAARLLRAARSAGGTHVSAALADALATSGDLVTAGRMAEEMVGSEDRDERVAAVRIAAAAAAHDGAMAQAADLYRWLGPQPDPVVAVSGVLAGVAVGDLELARSAFGGRAQGPPTSASRAARCLGDGVLASVDRPYLEVVSVLGRAAGVDADQLPIGADSAAAVAALAALHGGDPVRARSVLARALHGDGPAGPELSGSAHGRAYSHRHRLLQGWLRMQDGQLRAAGTDARAVLNAPDGPLPRRDALWAHALNTAIARRAGDSGALHTHWHAAMEVLVECSVDVFSVLPVGELWVAAVLLRRQDRVEHPVREVFAALESLGNPPLWSVPLQWAGVHAGILANTPEAVAPYGQALTSAAAGSTYARALATAGRTWLRVLAQRVDTDDVTAAARTLCQFGLTWDATRLASQAALHSPDARVSGAMLQLARDLKHTIAADESALSERPSAGPRRGEVVRPAAPTLSDREREVAELLLLGRPYRDIGSQLLISAKTVEHHVARIRRRLGAESRSEMLSMLRALLDTAPAASDPT